MNNRLKINSLKNKSLSHKSAQWLKQHMNDPFVRQAKKDGYISRAAYKLLEIQKKFNLIAKTHNIIELGSSPGGWSQVISQILHSGKIFAVDLRPMQFIHHKVNFIEGNFILQKQEVLRQIDDYFNTVRQLANQETLIINNCINGLISDMAPDCCGDNQIDHWRIIDLANNALDFALEILKKGGYFIVKIFIGGDEKDLIIKMRKFFKRVEIFKPQSSRKESSEIYLIGMGRL